MHHHQKMYDQPDEIDLFELLENLVKEKATILGITVLGGVLATLVAFIQPKSFSAEAVVNMAPVSNFAKVNAIIQLLDHHTPEDNKTSFHAYNEQIYFKYQKKLDTFDTIQHATKQAEAAQISNKPHRNYTTSNENILWDSKEGYIPGRTTLKVTSSDPREPEYLINSVILPYTQKQITEQIQADLQHFIDQEILRITNQIKDAELSFLANIKHRTIELEEALALAKSENIGEPLTSDFNAAIQHDTHFLLGTNLLKAQLESISKRTEQYRRYSNPEANDENKPFIREVAERVGKLERLKQIDTDFSELNPVVIERRAEFALYPDKPNKKLIITLGFILGGMIGIFAAMIKSSIRSRKEKFAALTNN